MMLEKKQNGNWKKYAYLYNKNKNIDFSCSCGKIYTSFPALYLHCQRKHGKKISAGLVKQQCIIAQNGKADTYRYTLREEDIQEQESQNCATSLMEDISTIMTAYNEDKEQLGEKASSSLTRYPTNLWRIKVLRKFMEFLAEQFDQNKETDLKDILYSMPYFFNSFVIGQKKELGDPMEYSVFCQIIYDFGDWLKQKGHTQLTTTFNKEETDEGNSEN